MENVRVVQLMSPHYKRLIKGIECKVNRRVKFREIADAVNLSCIAVNWASTQYLGDLFRHEKAIHVMGVAFADN